MPNVKSGTIPDHVDLDLEGVALTVLRPDALLVQDLSDRLAAIRGLERPSPPLGRGGAPLPPKHRQMKQFQIDLGEYQAKMEQVNTDAALLAAIDVTIPADWVYRPAEGVSRIRQRFELPQAASQAPDSQHPMERTLAYVRELMVNPVFGEQIGDALDKVMGNDLDPDLGKPIRDVVEGAARDTFQHDLGGETDPGGLSLGR